MQTLPERASSALEKRQALDTWGEYLETLTRPLGVNVVPLRREA